MEKPKFPKKASAWWNKPRSEMTDEQKELRRAYDREYRAWKRATDPEFKKKDQESYRKHVKNNKEEVYTKNAKWRKDNWESVYKQRKESGYIKRSRRKWYHNTAKHNKTYVITENLRSRVRSAIKSQNATKSKQTMDLIGCSVEFLKEHLENQFTNGMTWDNYGEWHIDHIKPCCSFDLSNEEEQLKCFNYMNLQPLWAKDNFIKSATDVKHKFIK